MIVIATLVIFALITLGCASASDADQNDLAIDDEISVDDSISTPNDEEVLTESLDASTGISELENDSVSETTGESENIALIGNENGSPENLNAKPSVDLSYSTDPPYVAYVGGI